MTAVSLSLSLSVCLCLSLSLSRSLSLSLSRALALALARSLSLLLSPHLVPPPPPSLCHLDILKKDAFHRNSTAMQYAAIHHRPVTPMPQNLAAVHLCHEADM